MIITGPADQLRTRVEQLAGMGVTEIACQPAGPDIAGELERFMAAVGCPPRPPGGEPTAGLDSCLAELEPTGGCSGPTLRSVR